MRIDRPVRHRLAFWIGCLAIVCGAIAHMPMFIMARHSGYRMAGMPMDAAMLAGMVLILVGLSLSAYGIFRIGGRGVDDDVSASPFQPPNCASLGAGHWKLVVALAIALAVDVLKPASIGFVIPGMIEEYGITEERASRLALLALVGTTVGSVVWGRVADVFGRRSAILLSALMFIGTAICGAMPSFEWNLGMCFLMGLSAGGLLPIAFTLMAETVPASHRSWLLVTLGVVGTSGGYLLAAGSAALLIPEFSWRALWLLGLPTGLLIIFLGRFIPESPHYLAQRQRHDEALNVLRRLAGASYIPPERATGNAVLVRSTGRSGGVLDLLRGGYARVTWGLILCGVSWGMVNFGFVLWLPTNLADIGVGSTEANSMLAYSALLALPGGAVVVWLYHRWSSIGALGAFVTLTAVTLLLFVTLEVMQIRSTLWLAIATASLLFTSSGVIATLIPYAAEVYPSHLRGTGSGIVAASSKLGGIVAAVLSGFGVFGHFAGSALVLAIPMACAALALARSGIETSGQLLEDIEVALTPEDCGTRG